MKVNFVPAAQGFHWYKRAFELYKKMPLQWTLITLAIFFIPMALSKIFSYPGYFLGEIIQTLLSIGAYRVGKDLLQGKRFDARLLYIDFNNSDLLFSVLLLKVVAYVLTVIILTLMVFINLSLGVTLKDLTSLIQIASTQTFYLIPPSFYQILLINLGLILISFMFFIAAFIFVPPLIAFQKLKIPQALKASLEANFKNIGAFLVMSLGTIPLFLLAIITLGLGTLVVVPILSLSLFIAYEELFPVVDSPAAPLP